MKWLKQQNSPFKRYQIFFSQVVSTEHIGQYQDAMKLSFNSPGRVLSFKWICVNVWTISPGTPQSSCAKKQTEVGQWHCWQGECSQLSWHTRNTGYAMATNLLWKTALPQGQKPWQRREEIKCVIIKNNNSQHRLFRSSKSCQCNILREIT